MRARSLLRRWLRARSRASEDVARSIEEEIDSHFAMRVEALMAKGLTRAEAEVEAVRRFGNVGFVREQLVSSAGLRARRLRRREWVASVVQDFAFAVRQARRTPGLALAVILTMALGIGATTAIVTIVHAALLQPLPYESADRLVHLWETKLGDVDDVSEASYPDYLDWKSGSQAFAAMEGYDPTNVIVEGDAGTYMLQAGRSTHGFLTMLGVVPALGRLFLPEDEVGGTVILSHGFWVRELGGDRSMLGGTLAIDGRAYTIIGVLPRDFHFAPIGDAQLWLTLDRSEQTLRERSNHWLNVVGRVRDDYTIEQARASLERIMGELSEIYPHTNAGRGILVVPPRDQIVGDMRPVLVVVVAAVALLLLIACANVASLLLARGVARSGEVAVRAALGARRGRLVQQFLTESIALACVGGALGIWLARGAVPWLVAVAPESLVGHMPYLRSAGLNGSVLLSAITLTLVTGLVFGVVPALTASRVTLAGLLRSAGRSSTGGSSRLRNALVAGEVALTTLLLIGAGLLTQSLRAVLRADSGFDTDRVLTMRIALSGPRYDSAAVQQLLFESVLERVRALPGVRIAGAVSNLPLSGGGTNTFRVEGQPEPDPAVRPEAVMRGVAGDYFDALGIDIVAGRALDGRDREGSLPAIMISQSIARRLFGSGDPVGERVRFYAFPDTTWTIVGVTADVKTGRLDAPPPPTIYYSHLQGAENRMSLVLRVAGDDGSLVAGVRELVRTSAPGAALYSVATMREQVARSSAVSARRYPLVLVAAFATAALALATIGLYGTISYSVAQRTREIGLRVALGARPGHVFATVLRTGAAVLIVGLLIGVIAAAAAGRVLSALLYEVSTLDPLTYTAVAILLTIVALAATCLPARRALRVPPLVALRSE